MSEAEDLFQMLENMERTTSVTGKDQFIRAPFGYPGGKSRSLGNLLHHLPIRRSYVEPFGGSGVVLLNRPVSQLEVYNDRYGGVVAFYRCLRDTAKLDALIDRLDLTVAAKEEWIWCHDTWDNCRDDVERAARWFYMHTYSFSNKGRCWGRQTKSKSMAGKVRDKLSTFPTLHQRFKNVQVENQDWRECIKDYASRETVFYHDPPYFYKVSFSKIYDHGMRKKDHEQLLNTIFRTKGFHAVSGYASDLYDSYDWDERHEWDVYVSVGGRAYVEGNNKAHLKDKEDTKRAVEVLWIKDVK